MPLDWAMAQNTLGEALRLLGEREAGIARLEQAEAAFRDALREWTRERVPLDWASAQSNLAKALAEIGTRQGDPARWRDALDSAAAALEVFETARIPHRAAEALALRDSICAKLEAVG